MPDAMLREDREDDEGKGFGLAEVSGLALALR
jgi:hypothetical protein